MTPIQKQNLTDERQHRANAIKPWKNFWKRCTPMGPDRYSEGGVRISTSTNGTTTAHYTVDDILSIMKK